jgi:catechol 2,3-dioxygenase-like lactoylglutathione lyase family enzyme
VRENARGSADRLAVLFKSAGWHPASVLDVHDTRIQLSVIGIVVADMARSLAFYRHLGLDLPQEADGQPHVEATLPGGLRLVWDTEETIRSFDPGWRPAAGSARISLAFLLGGPDAVDEQYEKLVALGYEGHRAPWDAFWGQRYAVVHDPDGNTVDLFCPA